MATHHRKHPSHSGSHSGSGSDRSDQSDKSDISSDNESAVEEPELDPDFDDEAAKPIQMMEEVRLIMLMQPEQRPAAVRALVERAKASPTLQLAGSRMQYLRRALKLYEAPAELAAIARVPEITRKFNDLQLSKAIEVADDPIQIPAGFELKRVAKRLREYKTSEQPTPTALHDVMIAGAMRPSEVERLSVAKSHGRWMASGYSKARDARPRLFLSFIAPDRFSELLGWIQAGIRGGVLESPMRTSANYHFKRAHDGATMRILRQLGAKYTADSVVYQSDASRAKAARKALRHKPEMPPSERYARIASKAPAAAPESSKKHHEKS